MARRVIAPPSPNARLGKGLRGAYDAFYRSFFKRTEHLARVAGPTTTPAVQDALYVGWDHARNHCIRNGADPETARAHADALRAVALAWIEEDGVDRLKLKVALEDEGSDVSGRR